MRILCPNCGFDRDVDEAKIAPRAQMATCPRCKHKFRFRVVDDLPPAGHQPAEVFPRTGEAGLAAGPGANPQTPDPLAAQRASAEQAWKRIQGVKPTDTKPEGSKQDGATPTESQPDASGPDAPASAGLPTPPEHGQDQGQNAMPDGQNAMPESAGISAGGTTGSPVPFEDLPRHGFFPGLWGTIRQVLAAPAAFFRSMPVSGGMVKPLIFHLLLAEFMVLSQYLWGLASLGTLSQYTGSQELMDMGLGLAGAGPILILVFYPLLLILRLMVMTGIIHLFLRVLFRFSGGPGSGAEATFRVLCYSAAPLILGVVPFLGPILGGVWSIGLTIIGLKEAHRTRGSVAMFAVLVPILMLLAALLGALQSGAKL